MQINTKYNLGDELWVIDHDDVVGFTVEDITISLKATDYDFFDSFPTRSELKIQYSGEGVKSHSEDKCFKTKEELINSLK